MKNSPLQHREAVLLSFRDPIPSACDCLRTLTEQQWQPLLHWLDLSGMALYFLDRITRNHLDINLPAPVLKRLQRNLADSKNRTNALIFESTQIQERFQQDGVSYAILKGFSLWPVSVQRLELRSQLDLDFLVAASDAILARKILEKRGYTLRAISGQTWEFKTGEPGIPRLDDLYRIPLQRSVELHLESASADSPSLLARTVVRELHGLRIPVLCQADLFLGQGLHLYKHLCSEHSRTAHLLEFYRHILVRFHDDVFWKELRSLAEQTPGSPEALGFATHLITELMGTFAPQAFTSWTVDRLSAPARLWVQLYGRQCVFNDPPGSKLYLLLRAQMPGIRPEVQRSSWRTLLPYRMPPRVFHQATGETRLQQLDRHRQETVFRLARLRFHVIAGLLYLVESVRWHHRLQRTAAVKRTRKKSISAWT